MVSRLECTRVHFVQVSVLVSRPKKGLDNNTGYTYQNSTPLWEFDNKVVILMKTALLSKYRWRYCQHSPKCTQLHLCFTLLVKRCVCQCLIKNYLTWLLQHALQRIRRLCLARLCNPGSSVRGLSVSQQPLICFNTSISDISWRPLRMTSFMTQIQVGGHASK